MPVVVVRKPKETEFRRGWRTRTRTTTRTRVIKKDKQVDAEARRAAQNAVLLRVRGVKSPAKKGVVEKVRGWVDSAFFGRRKQR